MPKLERRNLIYTGIALLVIGFIVYSQHIWGPITVVSFLVVIAGLLCVVAGLVQLSSGAKSPSDRN